MTTLEASQARVKAYIWQAIVQSGLDTSKVDTDTLNRIVDIATTAVLVEVDDELQRTLQVEQTEQAPTEDDILSDDKEDILWEGRPFMSLGTHYRITDERIRITTGLLGKSVDNIELVRIQHVDHSQSVTERMMNLGDITISSHDQHRSNLHLRNVSDPEKVYEILRRAILAARKKHGFTYREEM
jgi:hypothetical protein